MNNPYQPPETEQRSRFVMPWGFVIVAFAVLAAVGVLVYRSKMLAASRAEQSARLQEISERLKQSESDKNQ